MLSELSCLLDDHDQLLEILSSDLIDQSRQQTGCRGLSVESVFRCLLLKQMLNISYEKLAFHLSDSITYRTFTRLAAHQHPSRAGLQSVIRKTRPETLQQINQWLCVQWQQQGIIDYKHLRIDSTIVEADIALPSDSQLLDDAIRVLSRHLSICHRRTGLKPRFTDQRDKSRRLAFAVFYAKESEKHVLYPQLLSCASVVLKQVDRAVLKLELLSKGHDTAAHWIAIAQLNPGHPKSSHDVISTQMGTPIYSSQIIKDLATLVCGCTVLEFLGVPEF